MSDNTKKKPIVIGIYGISGSGKSYMLRQLKGSLGHDKFQFIEGSEVLNAVVPGGLDAFRSLPEAKKKAWRETAINIIQQGCSSSGKTGVVAGHLMFWDEGQDTPTMAYTERDMEVYTHIFYLSPPPDRVLRQRKNDPTRSRPLDSVEHLKNCMIAEEGVLRDLCLAHNILLCFPQNPIADIPRLILNFAEDTEDLNARRVEERLLEVLATTSSTQPRTMLVLDADRTLAPQDTGDLFWKQHFADSYKSPRRPLMLSTIFSSPMGYSYSAFRQAALWYDEVGSKVFDDICLELAINQVAMYPEMRCLLNAISNHDHVGAVVVTCGLQSVWEQVLRRRGLRHIQVLGGGQVSHGLVITPEIKADIVSYLRNKGLRTIAFGDSPVDIPMMKQADKAIVVVGREGERSTSMPRQLSAVLRDGHLTGARQVLLPSTVTPIINTNELPLVDITETEFIDSIASHWPPVALRAADLNLGVIDLRHATDTPAAQLLMTPMRDARLSGHELREVHRGVGWYLAAHFLGDVIGVEAYDIPHVQGHQTQGYRIKNEARTTIVALMRGGEPMAFGVSRVLPTAVFLHADRPEDVQKEYVEGMETVVLVDSVVNSGKTVVEFVHRVRGIDGKVRIVVVAGTVQAKAVEKGGALCGMHGVSFVALRVSENKFTGQGGTDTGNRLFNTTHLD